MKTLKLLLIVTLSACGTTNSPNSSNGNNDINKNSSVTRDQLSAIFADTLKYSTAHTYPNANGGNDINLSPVGATSKKFDYKTTWGANPRTQPKNIVFSYDKSDSVSSAIKYKNEGPVALLNFANAYTIGGAPDASLAQEESLMRSSNLYPALTNDPDLSSDQRTYISDISDNMDKLPGVLVTPNVSFFRNSQKDYDYLDTPETCTVISAAGLDMRRDPALKYGNAQKRLQLREKKWLNILKSAAQSGAKVFILGAIGAGVFSNNKDERKSIAQAFYNEIQFLEKFGGIYGEDIVRIHFPILINSEIDQEIYDIFSNMIDKINRNFSTRPDPTPTKLSLSKSSASLPTSLPFSRGHGVPYFNFGQTTDILLQENLNGNITSMIYNVFTHINLSQEKGLIEGNNALFFKGTAGFMKTLDDSTKMLIGFVVDSRKTDFNNTSISRYGIASGVYHNVNQNTKIQLGIDTLEGIHRLKIPRSIGAWVSTQSQLNDRISMNLQGKINSLENSSIQISIRIYPEL